MKEDEIKDKIKEIAESVVNVNDNLLNDERSLLFIILSNSKQAIHFVTLIEDEFDIEIDDEFINLDFFESFDIIYKIIIKYLN